MATLPGREPRCANMMFRFGTIYEAPLYIHSSFLLYALVQLIISITQTGTDGIIMSLIVLPIFLATILSHEVMHGVLAKWRGLKCSRMVLWPLGGLASCDHGDCSAADEATVGLLTPLVHAFWLCVWGLLSALIAPWEGYADYSVLHFTHHPDQMLHSILSWGLHANLGLLVFNLFLPVYPLDMSSVIATALGAKFGVRPAARVVWMCGFLSLVLLLVGAILVGTAADARNVGVSSLGVMALMWSIFQSIQLGRCIVTGTEWQHPLFDKCGGLARGHGGPHKFTGDKPRYDDTVTRLGGAPVGQPHDPGAPPVGQQDVELWVEPARPNVLRPHPVEP